MNTGVKIAVNVLGKMFKSLVDQEDTSVVMCDLNHTIVYMNPAAVRNYAKRGGAKLIGRSLLDCHNEKSAEAIKKIVNWFSESSEHNRIFTFHNEKQNKDVYMIALRDEKGVLVGYYEKHIFRDRETASAYDFSEKKDKPE